MANTILDAGGLKYVEMANARFARKPLPGLFASGTWSKIRVAVLLKCNDTGADISGTPLFQFGLCSGTTNIPGDATPTNAIGVTTNNSSWSRIVTVGQESYASTQTKTLTNVGGVITLSANLANPNIYLNTYTGTAVGSPWFVDITKGSPNFQIAQWYQSLLTMAISSAQYLTQSISAVPSFAGMTLLGNTATAFSEASGTLDSAFVYFNQASAMRILDWRVIKLA